MDMYDFSTLNSSDLEDLVCDLLNSSEIEKVSQIRYRTFKDGKDQGIDLLYSNERREHVHIGQVKHYYRSGFSKLLADLQNTEVAKVRQLKPERYLLATSVDLSPIEAKKIKKAFSPYIKSLSDIYGKKDLNRLLRTYPSVLEKHSKIWFSGATVLRKILHYETVGRSREFTENTLKKKIRLFVKTDSYDRASAILASENFLVITGEPGCGKTSLAERILYDYISKDYKLTYATVVDDINRGLNYDNSKQIFYYDDFLGHNEMQIINAKASEHYLISILEQIKSFPNKFIIFTTRTFLLNDAIQGSEKFARLRLNKRQTLLNLDEYNRALKEQMLANHLEESLLDDKFKRVLREPSIKHFLISHKNFYPRSIEFICSNEYLDAENTDQFRSYILTNFDRPDAIWKHAYLRQINNIDRLLLNTLLSFGNSCSKENLQEAFTARMNYEVKYNNLQRPFNPFDNAFSTLLGGFIFYEYHDDYQRIGFINPSLVDYLISYLHQDTYEVVRISESAIFPIQLTSRLFEIPKKKLNAVIPERLLKRLEVFPNDFVMRNDSDHLRIAMVILSYANTERMQYVASMHFNSINDWLNLYPEFDSTETLLKVLLEEITIPKSVIRQIGVSIYAPIVVFMYNFEKILELKEDMAARYSFELTNLIEIFPDYEWEKYFDEVLIGDLDGITTGIRTENLTSKKVEELQLQFHEYLDVLKTWGLNCRINPQYIRNLEQRIDDFNEITSSQNNTF